MFSLQEIYRYYYHSYSVIFIYTGRVAPRIHLATFVVNFNLFCSASNSNNNYIPYCTEIQRFFRRAF